MEFTIILILSAIGTCFTTLTSLAPLPSLFRAQKSGNLQEISYFFLLMGNINPLLWIIFSGLSRNIPVLICNSISYANGLLFLSWYHYIDKNFLIFLSVYSFAVMVSVTLHFFFIPVNVLGVLAAVTTMLSSVGPLDQIKITLVEKQSSYIDMNIIFTSTLNSAVWGVYGLLTHNYFILLPNFAGILVSAFPVFVYLWAKEWISCACTSRNERSLLKYPV